MSESVEIENLKQRVNFYMDMCAEYSAEIERLKSAPAKLEVSNEQIDEFYKKYVDEVAFYKDSFRDLMREWLAEVVK